MPIRPVLQLGDPRLREVAHPIEDPSAPEVAGLIRDLADTLAHWRSTTGYGRGIAAPQLGVRQARHLPAIAGRRALAADQPGDHRTQRRENRRLGRLPQLSCRSSCRSSATARSPFVIRTSRAKPRSPRRRRPQSLRTAAARNRPPRRASSPSTASPTSKPSAPAKNLKSAIADTSPYAVSPSTIKA